MRLPAQFGGMAFDDSVVDSGCKQADSIKCTTNLTQQILENGDDLIKGGGDMPSIQKKFIAYL